MEPTGTLTTLRDDALGDSDGTDLIERLQRRDVSTDELRGAALQRLRESADALNATVGEIDGVADAAPDPHGAFAGVPLPIKDTDDVAGYPTLWGSFAFPDTPAQRSSAFVRHLLDLGFAPLAKTTTPEFGLTATTQSERFGDTRNPWDLQRSVGGSSGGAAALVSAGVVPMAHANDGGGSVRIPAASCGLVGLKPTRGRLVDRPELGEAPINLFTQGMLTRSVRDTARFYAEAERLYANPELPPVGHVTAPLSGRLRIAVVDDGLAGIRLQPVVRAALERTMGLCADLGHDVIPVPNPYPDQAAKDFLRYWAMLAWFFKHFGDRIIGPGFDGSRTDAFTNGLAAMFTGQAERTVGSLRRLRRLAAAGGPLFDRFDVVLSPTLGDLPPALDRLGPAVPFRPHLIRLIQLVTTTPLENVTGSPAISLPLTQNEQGVPIGMQFSADKGREALLLGLAYQFEEAAPWPHTPAAITG